MGTKGHRFAAVEAVYQHYPAYLRRRRSVAEALYFAEEGRYGALAVLGVAYGAFRAAGNALHAAYTAGIVHVTANHLDAGCPAVLLAFHAAHAFVAVNDNLERGTAAEVAHGGA